MTAPRSDDIYLAELTVYDPSIAATRVLRYATGKGFTTKPSETPANTFYDARIIQPVNVKRDIFAAGATGGASRPGFGDLILNNEDGVLDALIDYGCDGRSIVVLTGQQDAAYPSGFTTIFSGTMEQPLPNFHQVNIRVRDRQFETDIPLQSTKFAGTNTLPTGLEGVDDLKGKPKPIVYGKDGRRAPRRR